jgi:hypothetical protein
MVLAGCGGDERVASTPTPTPTPTATPTAFAPSAPEPPTDAPEEQEGGAGDEEPIVQRVRLTLGEAGIRPQRSTVTAFLAIRLVVRNATDRERLVRVLGTTKALSLGPGVQATLDVGGLRPGTHMIQSEPGGRATLVVRTHEP